MKICRKQFKCNYPKNKKLFSNILLDFGKLHQIMNILENKMTLRAYVFPKLKTAKDVVRKVSEKPGSRLPFNSQHGKEPQTLLKSARPHFFQIFFSL